MGFARTAFGCVVYPKFSQIFVAGGSVNEYESTNKCERYMVTENKWKTLPDLNESKCNPSLCFFNDGNTLYCFGGLIKTERMIYHTSDKIERLSKG